MDKIYAYEVLVRDFYDIILIYFHNLLLFQIYFVNLYQIDGIFCGLIFTFLFSLVIYSSWYYFNINNLATQNEDITYLDKDNSNLDYVKVEDKQNVPLDNSNKVNNENIILTEKDGSKIVINENSNDKVVKNNKVGSKKLLNGDCLGSL